MKRSLRQLAWSGIAVLLAHSLPCVAVDEPGVMDLRAAYCLAALPELIQANIDAQRKIEMPDFVRRMIASDLARNRDALRRFAFHLAPRRAQLDRDALDAAAAQARDDMHSSDQATAGCSARCREVGKDKDVSCDAECLLESEAGKRIRRCYDPAFLPPGADGRSPS